MIKVGLTGNIGSGKSTVARIFEVLGVPVFNADSKAKIILDHPSTLLELKETFGSEVITDGLTNRKELAKLVFNNKKALDQLNAIIHPKVRQQLLKWFQLQSHLPMAIEEAAIIFESGIQNNFDKVITVSCPDELAIERVMQRDKISRQEILSRMANQWSRKKKEKLADFVIHNDEIRLLIPQIIEVHQRILTSIS